MNTFSVMMLNTLPFLLFFLQLDFATSEENIYVDYESNPDHPFPVLRWGVPPLKTSIIAQLREPTYRVCGLKCAENRFCVAMNYKEKAGWSEWNCQLTNTTKQKFDNGASKRERVWMFIKVNVDRSQVASCRGEVNECHNGGTMIWDPVKPFNCLCKEGYKGEICEEDLDECSEGNFTCHQNATCINTQGSYHCQCSKGFVGDGKKCADLDECSEGNFTCHQNATCMNTQGSYRCQCEKGFVGDGKKCEGTFRESVIMLNEPFEFVITLKEWLPKTGNWLLCWRGTSHGWGDTNFHHRCNGKRTTLTIVKVVKDKKSLIFGGYATEKWDGTWSGSYTSAPESFLFSLRNNDDLPPFKCPLKDAKDGHAIYRKKQNGPTFGRGHDLYISHLSRWNGDSRADIGLTYEAPHGYTNGHTNTRSLLAGKVLFSPIQVEVLYLN